MSLWHLTSKRGFRTEIYFACCRILNFDIEWFTLFNKTSVCLKLWIIGHRFFLFNTEDNYNATKQTFVARDLAVYEF